MTGIKRQSWNGVSVGQRVEVLASDGSRPRATTGTVAGFAVTIDSIRVLIDGNKTPTLYESWRVVPLEADPLNRSPAR